MKTAMALGMAAMAFILVACGAEDDESTEASQDSLSAACITGITAPPGSPAWKAELEKCIEDAVGGGAGGGGAGGGGGAKDGGKGGGGAGGGGAGGGGAGKDGGAGGGGAGKDGGAGGGGAGGGPSCSSGVSCVDGACSCTSGPAKGKSCDGSTATGASSCSVVCRWCD